jgi:hypothetical protein
VRAYASAFLVATAVALLVDVALQLALDAVKVSNYGSGAPWWVTAHLIERGRWVALAILLWLITPRLFTNPPVAPDDRQSADPWHDVAIAVGAVPLLWIAATWIVTAARFTLLGSWATDGRVFASPDYYRALLVDLAPWLLASAAVLAVRRHLG